MGFSQASYAVKGIEKLTASDAAISDQFGHSVSISGDKAIVGAHSDDDNGSNSGSVYVYDLSASKNHSSEMKLTASDGDAGDNFGFSVSISGDTVIVGAPQADKNGQNAVGSAYVYDLGAADILASEIKLTAPSISANDNFGSSASISDDQAIVGALAGDKNKKNVDSGSAYIYDLSAL